MKTNAAFIILFAATISLSAQEKKVEIVSNSLYEQKHDEATQETVLSCGVVSCGAKVVDVPYDYHLPFKVYDIPNNNWTLQQDIYNALEANVPSLRVANRNDLATVPKFNIRGDDATIVILDGVRVDASILNTINPADIESIKVAPSATARNYFLSNPNF